MPAGGRPARRYRPVGVAGVGADSARPGTIASNPATSSASSTDARARRPALDPKASRMCVLPPSSAPISTDAAPIPLAGGGPYTGPRPTREEAMSDLLPASLPTFDSVEDERLHRKQRLAAAFRLFGK